MDQILLFALLGLGTGALIAGVGLGVVLNYRGAGVINLATGAVAMVAGYAAWTLSADQYGIGLPLGVAFALSIVCAVVLGLAIQLLVFRPLQTSSPLAKLVASLGVLLVLQAGVVLLYGTSSQPLLSILPTSAVPVFGAVVPADRFWLTAIVIAATIGLTLLYSCTRFGVATRAVAENEEFAMLAGLSTGAVSLLNVALASAVAGALGVLAAPLVQLDSNILPLQIVPALAAALFARFTSFSITCIAGLALGVLQSIVYYLSTQSWFPTDNGNALPGLAPLITFVAVVVALYVRGASLPGRGDVLEKRLPAAPRPERLLRPAVTWSVAAAVALVVLPYGYRQALVLSIIGTVVCLSLVVIAGFVGQVSLMQVALAGLCGFFVSHAAVDWGIGFPFGPLLGTAAATLVGFGVGASALRVRGVSLAVVTLAAAQAIEQFGFANSTWGAGSSGSPVPNPQLLGLNLGTDAGFRGLDGNLPSPVLGFLALAVAVALSLLVANIRRSTLGRRMLAVRSNERAAAAAGINVRNVKFAAFAISSFVAGTAGWLYAYNFGSVSAVNFSTLTALGFVAFAYVGGITVISGAVIGGLIATGALVPYAIQQWTGLSGTWTLLLGGVLLLVNLIFAPEGIAGKPHADRRRKRRARMVVALPEAAVPSQAAR
jgi:branched-subunit amino acid ABC-type transport system permease component